MKRPRSFPALSAAWVFGAVTLVAQTLLLRRFLWRFESAETGVALFLSCWLFWSGLGAAVAATRPGRRLTDILSRFVWGLVALCVALYFAQYALIENFRGWLGIPDYQAFPLLALGVGCLIANAPFCFVAGFVIPAVCRRLEQSGGSVSRAFAWEALGAALGGLGVAALLLGGVTPDPRDEVEWRRYFPQAAERPGRFETTAGTTFFGSHGGTFYALSSGGVGEVIPEKDRAMGIAALILSQRPYAKDVLLLGQVPLAVGLALESIRPGLNVAWCPCDAQYGINLLREAQAKGVRTGVRVAGLSPQSYLAGLADDAFDAVLAVPPSAASLAGAVWRDAVFAQGVRRVTRRTGVAIFGLDCGTAVLTPEKSALLDVTVRGVRQAWPESGLFAAGAGGWWLAAQVPRLVYGVSDATNRFAMLKRDVVPLEAVAHLYDPVRAGQWMKQAPVLDPGNAVLLPGTARAEEILALGFADALRRAYPEQTPGSWLAWLKAQDCVRLIGFLLVVLWMLPVALGGREHAERRLLAAWLAACGALGLAVSLTVLYRVQMRFGSVYLLAGVGSCLYLAGLFCGNRLTDGVLWAVRERPRALRGMPVLFTLIQSGVAFGVLACAERAATATGVVLLCFAAGCAAGAAVPTALAVCDGGGSRADRAAVFVLADALGAAVAGLFFVAGVPLAGLWEMVACFSALACGLALCTAAGHGQARLTAAFAVLVALAVLGGRLRDAWPVWPEPALQNGRTQVREPSSRAVEKEAAQRPGIPRRVDLPRILEQMRGGQLATNAAAFWESE